MEDTFTARWYRRVPRHNRVLCFIGSLLVRAGMALIDYEDVAIDDFDEYEEAIAG